MLAHSPQPCLPSRRPPGRLTAGGKRPRALLAGALSALALGAASTATAGAAPAPRLLADVNPGPSTSAIMMKEAAQLGGYQYFAASDGIHGRELWRTDGATTTPVADIRPGFEGSDARDFQAFAGHLYFIADDGVHGRELWRTDGATTTLVADIRSGSGGSQVSNFVVFAGRLYFAADDDTHGRELWRTDGAAIAPLTEINPGAADSVVGDSAILAGHLYFSADDGAHGVELWRTDGTTTELVEDVAAGSPGSGPGGLTPFAGQLYFNAATATFGRELWRTDGSGAEQVADIRPGAGVSSVPIRLTRCGAWLCFVADDGVHGREPWRTDGATPSANTTLLADINQAPGFPSEPQDFATLGGQLYFSAEDGVHGEELWRTDGQATALVADLDPGPGSAHPNQKTAAGGTLYFTAELPSLGAELWALDGAGAALVGDILPGTDGSDPEELVAFGGTLYFTADDGSHGYELWRLAEPSAPPPSSTPASKPPAGAADTRASIMIRGGKLRLDRRGRVKVRLACPAAETSGPCRGTIRLRARQEPGPKKVATPSVRKPAGSKQGRTRTVALAKARFSIAAGTSRAVTLRLKPKRAKLVRRNRVARKVRVIAAVRDGAGNAAVASRTLRLKPATGKPGARQNEGSRLTGAGRG